MIITPAVLPNGARVYLAQHTIRNRHNVATFFVSVTGKTHTEALIRAGVFSCSLVRARSRADR